MRSETCLHSSQAEGGQKARANDAEQQSPQHRDDADSPEEAKLRPADLTVSFMKVRITMERHMPKHRSLTAVHAALICALFLVAPCMQLPLSESSM